MLFRSPGATVADVAVAIQRDLAKADRSVLREGQPITDPEAALVVLADTARQFLAERAPILRRLGGLGAA